MTSLPHESNPELERLAVALGALSPRPPRWDQDRLMFLAGQASVASHPAPHQWTWSTAFGGMSALAASLLVVVIVQFRHQAIVSAPRAVNVAHVATTSPPDEIVAENTTALPGPLWRTNDSRSWQFARLMRDEPGGLSNVSPRPASLPAETILSARSWEQLLNEAPSAGAEDENAEHDEQFFNVRS